MQGSQPSNSGKKSNSGTTSKQRSSASPITMNSTKYDNVTAVGNNQLGTASEQAVHSNQPAHPLQPFIKEKVALHEQQLNKETEEKPSTQSNLNKQLEETFAKDKEAFESQIASLKKTIEDLSKKHESKKTTLEGQLKQFKKQTQTTIEELTNQLNLERQKKESLNQMLASERESHKREMQNMLRTQAADRSNVEEKVDKKAELENQLRLLTNNEILLNHFSNDIIEIVEKENIEQQLQVKQKPETGELWIGKSWDENSELQGYGAYWNPQKRSLFCGNFKHGEPFEQGKYRFSDMEIGLKIAKKSLPKTADGVSELIMKTYINSILPK
mmetsp:Transcript_21627/g.30241  ORF Transcript_21627/g.30241 Transcript_21627/m.30241 type:complete len:329 (-) Transcript_21627:51-1037(-)